MLCDFRHPLSKLARSTKRWRKSGLQAGERFTGRMAHLDIDALEETAVNAEALGTEHVVWVVHVPRRAAHKINQGFPNHGVW